MSIAHKLHIGRPTVYQWLHRFNEHSLAEYARGETLRYTGFTVR
ncbi:helix-turn-helix domain-containing protein [Singulisphaera sp. Ch08]|uniref:Helix-turn-helix domain-containing protein n=1 Tax=Singulisphaera sp. Ch08 TaxID=3120278 RepID=A0AAU7CDR8_9BACT